MQGGSGPVVVSADLEPSRELEICIFDEQYGRNQVADLVTERSFVFACAGLEGMIDQPRPWEQKANTCYLFGEISSNTTVPQFENLTFSILSQSHS